MNGHIKLHRSILDWEWWDDINTFRLFTTILLLANWKEQKWHGKVIPRGSLWTSLPALSEKSGLTIQQTRTSLNKLKSTGEITDESTGEGRLVTVVNYGFYQSSSRRATDELTDELTDEQQTSNRRVTATKEYIRSNKKGKKEGATILPDGTVDFFSDIE